MKKFFYNFLIFILVVPSVACAHKRGAASYDPPVKSFVKVFRKIKIIECKPKNEKCTKDLEWISSGSGMTIETIKGKYTVLTAGHMCIVPNLPDFILNHTTEIYVVDTNGFEHAAKIIYSTLESEPNGRADLCSLEVPTLDVPKVKVANKAPKIGEDIYTVSSPMGVFHPPVVPIFKGVFSGNVNSITSLVTLPSSGGASGAAVFNQQNRIIGVIFAVHATFPNITLTVNHRKVVDFINKTKFHLSTKK